MSQPAPGRPPTAPKTVFIPTTAAPPVSRRAGATGACSAANGPEIVMYTSAICPYCVAAKNFLKSKGQVWTEIRIDLDPAQREIMMARARRTSVPQIFIGQTHVGGYDDMIALPRAGGLEPLLSPQ